MNHNQPTISIIIPVYQTEPYLHTCIDSVLSQSFSDFELLLIDDGSTDQSGAICDQYTEIDSRIQVFHQKNQGQSVARNLGLKHAKGKYLAMIDSDDILMSQDYLIILLDAIIANDAQISVCKTSTFTVEDKITALRKVPTTVNCISGKDFCYMQKNKERYDFNSPCAKLYLREVFDGIEYPAGRLSQDIAIAHKLIFPCDTIALVPEFLYGYRIWSGSSSISSPYDKIIKDLIFAFQERINYFKTLGLDDLAEYTEQEMLRFLAIKKNQLKNMRK